MIRLTWIARCWPDTLIFDLEQIREYKPRLAEICDLQRVHIGIPAISRLITPAHLVSAGGCMTAADAGKTVQTITFGVPV